MNNFNTVEEKSVEWGLTTRHIQNLCRQGKIEGATKRVGAWFIPQDAACPSKNTNIKDKPFMFVGTKKKIFENAIKLITLYGYENVSINDIANEVNIRQSAVYNHFKSKQEILDMIYNFYHYYFFATRPTINDLEPIMQNGSILDIIKSFSYYFDEDAMPHMLSITKIIMQRKITDERAREIFKVLILEEGIKLVEDGLKRAIEIGRLAPFDIHSVSVMINSIRIYTLYWWLVDISGDRLLQTAEEEATSYKYIADLLIDLKPSESNK